MRLTVIHGGQKAQATNPDIALFTHPVLKPFTATLSANEQAAAADALRRAFMDGESNSKATTRVCEVTGLDRRNGETLVRTGMQIMAHAGV